MFSMLYLDWSAIVKLCEQLAKKVSNYKPDVLVGISRGGLVPVRLLSDLIGNSKVAIIKIEFYKKIGKTKDKPTITQALNYNVHGKRVLIVDDVSDTGKSLIAAREHVLSKKPKEVKIATLHYKPYSKLKPDYFVETTSKWIVYPWEIHETEREMKKKLH